MVSKGMRRVLKLLSKRSELELKKRVSESRKNLENLASLIELPEDAIREDIEIKGIKAAWINIPQSENDQIIYYLHGGGYMEGSIRTHQDLAMRIGKASRAKVLLIDYSLAPEKPYPAALNDSVEGYKWLIKDQKISPSKIIIAGDSAGGGLTLATLMKLRDLAITLPAAGICLSPWTDLLMTGNSIGTKSQVDISLKVWDLYFMASLYMQKNDPKDPYISPLYGDFQGLPPLYIQVGNSEIILNDSTRVAERAKEANVEVILDIWDNMIHVFQAFADWASEGKEAINKLGEFARSKFR
ncbi:MAG: alpha/beta hydrolase fold domain-containing protein [Candidatus Lokiarchaeota archaeon]|nr:alpha/beta hydrolase fold domain-containing protein [Candidatus Lokiarchaeota archaeon]MBD3201893.1 alpha/beta hydrolase fold domain-containing protein [Candidatus Lokiarchaeota archaeon]